MLPLRVFELEKDAGDGMAGAKFLGSKELTYHPGTSIFPGTFQYSYIQS